MIAATIHVPVSEAIGEKGVVKPRYMYSDHASAREMLSRVADLRCAMTRQLYRANQTYPQGRGKCFAKRQDLSRDLAFYGALIRSILRSPSYSTSDWRSSASSEYNRWKPP